MVIFKNVKDIQQYISEKKAAGLRPGFIPTMGALHAGHLSLIGKAKEDGMLVICSIFVNPTQFNDKKDFEQYPVSIDADIELLVNAGCDVLFLPPQSEIYPEGVEKGRNFSIWIPGHNFGRSKTTWPL
jgi:pantoate--beta-alanine ligase